MWEGKVLKLAQGKKKTFVYQLLLLDYNYNNKKGKEHLYLINNNSSNSNKQTLYSINTILYQWYYLITLFEIENNTKKLLTLYVIIKTRNFEVEMERHKNMFEWILTWFIYYRKCNEVQ